jgi:hypothetical protein
VRIAKGVSRIVILTKKHAIKIPNFASWEQFLWGLMGNLSEWKWAGYSRTHTREAHICPTLWRIPGGFLNVMVRADAVIDTDKFWMDYNAMLDEVSISKSIAVDFLKSDAKPHNFGYLDGVLVKIDYAS